MSTFTSTKLAQASAAIGTPAPPPGVSAYNAKAGGGIGLIAFFSSLLMVATVIAGLWMTFNAVMAGYSYITAAGDSGAAAKARNHLTLSVYGFVIIILAYTIVGIISLMLFGDAAYILDPKIPQAP